MQNDTYISFYLPTSRIHIFSKAIADIGNPRFIRFLVSEDGTSMIVEAYNKKDFHSHRVPKKTVNGLKMEVRSLLLCKALMSKLGWTDRNSYRIPGKVYPMQHLAVFDLTEAMLIQKS